MAVLDIGSVTVTLGIDTGEGHGGTDPIEPVIRIDVAPDDYAVGTLGAVTVVEALLTVLRRARDNITDDQKSALIHAVQEAQNEVYDDADDE